jgi:hypothetical protein
VAHTTWVLAGLAIAVALPAGAQGTNILLTGAPLKTIDEPFTAIAGVRELPGNKAVVADRGEKKIMMVDFAKGAVTSIGRNGSGPGEFQLPAAVFPGTGTDTWVADPQAGKVQVVSADGKLKDALLPPDGDGMPLFLPRAVDAAGRFYYQAMGRPDQGGSMDSASIIRWDRSAKRVDTLGRIPTGMSVNTSGSSGGNMRVMVTSKPWTATPVWSALPDGRVALVQPSPYRVEVLGANKAVTRGPVQPYTPIKVTAAERKAYRDALKSASPMTISRSFGSGGGGGNAVQTTSAPPSAREIPDEDFPAVMPPFSGQGSVLVSPQGEIWVLRTRPASDKTPKYDIFNSSGVLVGKATLKPHSTVVGFGSGVIYVARQDPEDDLRYLEMYSRGRLES